ncbi:MAG: hypothetical protein ACUVYA_19175, partial [Planctomycetota bacterium]
RCGAALALAGLPAPRRRAETAEAGSRPRVALVFLSRSGSSWPHPKFDVVRREGQVVALLEKGCPEVEFVPIAVRDPEDIPKAAAARDGVDGYLVYVLTLAWPLQRAIPEIGALGKPTLVADEFLGGSGSFLCGLSDLRRRGLFAAAVATTRAEDLVTAARCFRDVRRPGTTPESFARACSEAYRGTFGRASGVEPLSDAPVLRPISECVERFRASRFLIVGAGAPGAEVEFLGAKGICVGFEELQAAYEKADRDEAAAWARRWKREAERVVEASEDWIQKAGAVHVAMLELLAKHRTDSITMNCLGGFASGKLPAYPCLGFKQILDEGGQGVCEAMPDDMLSMLLARILTGRPGYVSDPALDTSKAEIVYAHCMATTKAFGPSGRANTFRIRTLHDHDGRGTAVQSFLPAGYMTTSFRTNFRRKEFVVHQARAVGNLDADRGCRTQLVAEVRGDIEKLFNEWDRFGWHRVTVYGDVKEPLVEFARALGLSVVEEA